ncbi:hypothetical protein [Comamonas thiooxydans]|uniref:hypothetical protein n=1 Tax=Comamonas thiooxydans TaxID=363952 RepID=UPI00050FFEB6|nr:hypothetical protein [Comamonas thiooxydans]KGG88635.1 hypothetical protein P369_17520 [Comamonas thiooxydans]KGG99542.1 hypothetical protein P367_10515 [Comamonas thiooxydans]KGH03975.1 hypothetical protein P365_16420 [Comamonas thiooxydans]KGH11343.1 hypothetical protein P368_15080 [Comamonas thiooxydans]TZG12386.1 hypothetical protein FZC30_01810 [Comamonas thiooxydans]
MSRYVIQSAFTGAFLSPDPDDGQPRWVLLLRDACTVDDMETAVEMIADHVDEFHKAQVIDLDEL